MRKFHYAFNLLVLSICFMSSVSAGDADCLVSQTLANGHSACITKTVTTQVIDAIPSGGNTTLSSNVAQGILLGDYTVETFDLVIEQGANRQTPWQLATRTHSSLYPPTYPRIYLLEMIEVDTRLFIFYVNTLALNVQVLVKDANHQWHQEMLLSNLAVNVPERHSESVAVSKSDNGIHYDITTNFNRGLAKSWRYRPGKGIEAED